MKKRTINNQNTVTKEGEKRSCDDNKGEEYHYCPHICCHSQTRKEGSHINYKDNINIVCFAPDLRILLTFDIPCERQFNLVSQLHLMSSD